MKAGREQPREEPGPAEPSGPRGQPGAQSPSNVRPRLGGGRGTTMWETLLPFWLFHELETPSRTHSRANLGDKFSVAGRAFLCLGSGASPHGGLQVSALREQTHRGLRGCPPIPVVGCATGKGFARCRAKGTAPPGPLGLSRETAPGDAPAQEEDAGEVAALPRPQPTPQPLPGFRTGWTMSPFRHVVSMRSSFWAS